MAHPIENILRTTMEQLKQIADVNTVIGAPVVTSDNTIILPVSRITLGFVSGGGEYARNDMQPIRRSGMAYDASEQGGTGSGYPFIGSSVVGVSMHPTAFLTVQDGHVSILAAETDCTVDRLVDRAPQLVAEAERLIRSLHAKRSEDKKPQEKQRVCMKFDQTEQKEDGQR